MTSPESMRAAKRTLRQAEPRREWGVSPQLEVTPETHGDFAKAFVVLLMWVAALYLLVIAVAIS